MPYFIMKQKKVEQNNKYCIDIDKVSLQAVQEVKCTKILHEFEPCVILK